MSVRDDVLRFLREPHHFVNDVDDPLLWNEGLDSFVTPSVLATGDYGLRPAQETAWRGLAGARTGLILGPPGTGKTHLLSWMITAYVATRRRAGKPARVLVSAFTRNAIGNVLDAVAARQKAHDPTGSAPMYFGDPPDAGLSPQTELLDRRQGRQLLSTLETGHCVVGMTVWSLYRLLSEVGIEGGDGRTAPLFDLICIDEASQMVLGHGLMALAGLAPRGRVVVAGDDKQLPPIRAGRPVQIDGRELGGSLYAFLKSVNAPEFALDETFRLNEPLASFPERAFYPGRYFSRANQSLTLAEDWRTGLDPVSEAVLDPDWPLVVLVYDGKSASTVNPFEANLTSRFADELEARFAGSPSTNFWSERLAIISPHRAQNAAIRSALPDRIRDGAFVETVDRIQGKERDAVIFSYCVSDPEFALAEGEFIFSSERLNVATTRARTKLIVLISRRLLEAVPSDQELVDRAELLREFVYSCQSIGVTSVQDQTGQPVRVELRGRNFDGRESDVDLSVEGKPLERGPLLGPKHDGVLAVIRSLAVASDHASATLANVRKQMALPSEPWDEAADLHKAGLISLEQRKGRFGPFWTARPFETARRVYDVDEATVRQRIEPVIREAKNGKFAFYERVRDRFRWMGAQKQDILRPVIENLATEGLITPGATEGGSSWVAMNRQLDAEPIQVLSPLPELSDDDFELLNRLEDIECRRINFGIFDAWTSSVELSNLVSRQLPDVALTLSLLAEHGHVLLAEEGRVRSRTAELARELRHVKQRFRDNDAGRRPYLVRSLKVELRDRMKPERKLTLDEAFAPARAVATESQTRALDSVAAMLVRQWGHGAKLAKFQSEGLEAILSAWNGSGQASIAIAADTGSGKTEAAALPLIAAALADKIDGIQGSRVILAYPRVRLAANQAQRLAGYLAALCADGHVPQLTLGLQVAEVPRSFDGLTGSAAELWTPAGLGQFVFPFFNCPSCSGQLALRPGAGTDGSDLLKCGACDWRFGGWIGTKEGLRRQPPNLFLPTTESLHQWMHDPDAGRIFGDDPKWSPPRALLADEIHLYTHVHGAQVGMALQRLAARAQTNDPRGREFVAIGMSATIGDPSLAWGRLIGRDKTRVIEPSQDDRRRNPRGREVFYFLQPEVESRGVDIAGASTTIQSLMCLSHGMRRRTGSEGGFRSLVFFDSIDKMRRLHAAFMDAEEGKELASLRTHLFGDDPSGEPQVECCGEPIGCDRHRDGECWWFAARDPRQIGAKGLRRPGQPLRVADRPIFSGTRGAAEKIVKDSDVVFATSSLEVGYDDPDITLVYQHYAPLNLASFVQRKGRGGRGSDDRPTTGVTLSIYSPRDAWWFRKPEDMIVPKGFRTPLNPGNAFVRRAHAVAAMLDDLARKAGQGEIVFRNMAELRPDQIETTRGFVEAVLGARIWDELEVRGPIELWQVATAGTNLTELQSFPKFRQAIDWVPNALFETINLPSIGVNLPGANRPVVEDAAHILHVVAPGNATRRFDGREVHWRPPVLGLGPWLTKDDYRDAQKVPLYDTSVALLRELPADVRQGLSGVAPHLCRPKRVTVERLGRMAGSEWTADVGYRRGVAAPFGPINDNYKEINHDSRGELRGFLLVDATIGAAEQLPKNAFASIVATVEFHKSGLGKARKSGLAVTEVFWGADSEIRFVDREEDAETIFQTFAGPNSGAPLLHGCKVNTEGLRFHVASERIDSTVDATMRAVEKDEGEARWRAAQFTRYLVESGAKALGINAYEARRGADLVVAAAGSPLLREELQRVLKFWDSAKFAELLERTRQDVLSQDPTLTQRRVARTASAVSGDAFRTLIKDSFVVVKDPARMRHYLRSTILHGLSLRLRSWAALHGHGDEGRMFAHVKLPLQFGVDAEEIITIAEAGAHGDGTVRAVVESWKDAAGPDLLDFLASCPNAEQDTLVRRFWGFAERHAEWRTHDPRDERRLQSIAAELSPQIKDAVLPAPVFRMLFGSEIVGVQTFTLYDLAADIELVRGKLKTQMKRDPTEWELVSASVTAAETGEASELSRLHDAYGRLDEKDEEAFSPSSRLADQVLRIAAPLCSDGCRACVHQRSDLMGDGPMRSSTSRTLLERFLTLSRDL
ncbi:MAG: AAA family ATPase [Nitrospiraceae bacterium]|nr:AAA family ATPase [Nitrospiraceae bacterium]